MIVFISPENEAAFLKKVNKFKNLCEKYNHEPIVKFIGTTLKDVKVKGTDEVIPAKVLAYDLASTIKIPGEADIVGKIVPFEGRNFLRAFGELSEPISSEDFDKPLVCEHCGRPLKSAFLVKHNGKYKVVGTSCAKLYRGIDTQSIALANEFSKLITKLSDYTSIKKQPKYYEFSKLVHYMVAIQKVFNNFSPAIKGLAIRFHNGNFEGHEDLAEKLDPNITIDIDDPDFQFLKECDKVPTFLVDDLFNLIINHCEITKDNTHYEYYGEIGEKFEVNAHIKFSGWCEGFYGDSRIYKFEVIENNVHYPFVYFTQKQIDEGTYKISGKIKSHNDYKHKETVVTRLKISNI